MSYIILEPIYEKIPVNEYQEPVVDAVCTASPKAPFLRDEPVTINDTIDIEEENLTIPNKIDPTLSHLFSKNGCSISTVFIAFFWCWLIPVCVLVFSACMNYPAQVCDPIRFPYMIASVVIMLFFSTLDIILSKISSCDNSFSASLVTFIKFLSLISALVLIVLIIANECDVYLNGSKIKSGLQFNNGIVMIMLIVTLCFYIIKEIIMISTWITLKKHLNKDHK